MDMIVSKVFHEFYMILFLQILLNQFLELKPFLCLGFNGYFSNNIGCHTWLLEEFSYFIRNF